MTRPTKQERYFPPPETARRLVYDMNLASELWRRHAPELSGPDLLVLLAYRDRCNWKKKEKQDGSGAGWVSKETLAEDTKLNKATVSKHRRALMLKGYLEPDYTGQDDVDATPMHPAVPEDVWQAFAACVSKRHRKCQYHKRNAHKVSAVIEPGQSFYQHWRGLPAEPEPATIEDYEAGTWSRPAESGWDDVLPRVPVVEDAA